MAARLKPSEFGGTTQRNGIAPPVTPNGHTGHVDLLALEKLRLIYLTGQDEDTTRKPDDGEAFTGILPLEEALEIMPQPAKWIDEVDV